MQTQAFPLPDGANPVYADLLTAASFFPFEDVDDWRRGQWRHTLAHITGFSDTEGNRYALASRSDGNDLFAAFTENATDGVVEPQWLSPDPEDYPRIKDLEGFRYRHIGVPFDSGNGDPLCWLTRQEIRSLTKGKKRKEKVCLTTEAETNDKVFVRVGLLRSLLSACCGDDFYVSLNQAGDRTTVTGWIKPGLLALNTPRYC